MTDDKSPFEMTGQDFRQLGFASGLEVHQQLDTRQKLFCHCPVGYLDGPHDAELLRHMRPTLSELGEYDGTALMEFKTRKQVRYQLFSKSMCTYEMDDTPPFPINQDALDIAIRVGLLFDCNLVDELHVSRKQYLDGSIPGGFQRTAIVGIDGSIPVGKRRVGIFQIGLEEDACREVEDHGHTVVFRTDRLSTPLVEVVTRPEFEEPAEVAEGAEVIRRLLRASESVRRGAGATRADVNVSIAGGTRVEIKGVPRIAWFERLVRVEAWRQHRLLGIREQLKVRGVSSSRFNVVIRDVTDSCRGLRVPNLSRAVRRGDRVMAVCLPGFGGLLNLEVQPGVPFAREFAGRIRVIACLDEMPNLVHTDDEALWQNRERDLKRIRSWFSAHHFDAIVLVWGPPEDAETAAEEVRLRALDALAGVPSETRQAFPDGTTDFERILPGPDRMYPDTDSPPVRLEEARVERIRTALPEPFWTLQERYGRLGLSPELTDDVLLKGPPSLFERLVDKTGARAVDVAVVLCQILPHLLRSKRIERRPDEEALTDLFTGLAQGQVTREAVPGILKALAAGRTLGELLDELAPVPALEDEVDEVIANILSAELRECHSEDEQARFHFAMGRGMARLRGRLPGQTLAEVLRPRLS